MKKAPKIFLSIIGIILLLLIGGYVYLYSQISPVSQTASSDVRFEVSQGESVRTIAAHLEEAGLIKNQTLFYYSMRFPSVFKILFGSQTSDSTFVLKSGIYHLNYGMTYAQITQNLASGQQEYIKVSIPEGKTISQIGNILEEAGICNALDFKAECSNKSMLKARGINGENAEGFLFPDTYFLTSGMSAQQVCELMIDTFFEKISTIPGMSELSSDELYETVILASIVEREYRVEDEAPLIASVFKNRLRHNIGLYSCATIVYIITEIEGRPHPDRVLLEDTKIDSPYNTYKWAGLPPGPISNPGLVALEAAANPPKTDYYFFQVVDAQAGRHVFTTTFDEHKASHNLSTKN
ncbi:MAG: endolytic transglycosylase MltG [Treponema sp.]|nr:endolytic transglycosylase MltG [Treponema sp.]